MKNEENAKREMTIEELREQLNAAQDQYESLSKIVSDKEKEAKERREATLALQKENRKKEIEEKEKELNELLKNYCKDYGSYSATRNYKDDDYYPFFWKSLGWF